MRDFSQPRRSVVHAVNGAAATSHPLSTLAAIDILRAGGNAVDAAIAACAVQCVVEPMSTGIGGDCFVLMQKGGKGEVVGLNGSGHAPTGLTADHLLSRGVGTIEALTPECVTVPGAVDAWSVLAKEHGKLGLDRLLQPAIAYAEEGFAVTPRVAWDWGRTAEKLSRNEHSRRILLKDGRAPQAGERWALPELGRTLRLIAREGRDAFYAGRVAEETVSYLRSLGGTHTLDDFAAQRCEYVTPIRTAYRGHEVVQIPPNGQGITVLHILNILSELEVGGLDPLGLERMHQEIQAVQLGYAMRDTFVGDPRQVEVAVERLLSREFAAEQRAKIRRGPLDGAPPAAAKNRHKDTVYITVVDRDRTAVSFINSLFNGFGSGLTTPTSGITLHNRGCNFVVKPGHPNCVAPRKRPMHTIIPGMVLKDGECVLSYGVMGGHFQSAGHTHFLSNVLDFGMDVQAALETPRAYTVAGRVELEEGVPQGAMDGLAALGHKVARVAVPWGGGQAVHIDRRNGTLAAGSDPRKDGCALGC
jgi:gamma-glutamyltranspeptidase / glutathione hydrolase